MSCDAVICGAGPVGAAVAIGLARQHKHPILLEPQPDNRGHRSYVLNRASMQFLTSLLPGEKLKQHTTPLRCIEVSATGHIFRSRLRSGHEDALGHVVVEHELVDMLRETAEAEGVEMRLGDSALRCQLGVDGVEIETARGESLSADVLIGSDGLSSWTARQVPARSFSHDYRQTALVGSAEVDAPPAQALLRFLEDGSFAMLPRREKAFGVVRIMDSDKAQGITDATGLKELVTSALGERFGVVGNTTMHGAYPVILRSRTAAPNSRTLLLGAAGQMLHPIGAQGLNLSFREVRDWLELCETEADLGRPRLLENFDAHRWHDRQQTMNAVDALARAHRPALRAALGLCLAAQTIVPPLQRLAIDFGGGKRSTARDAWTPPN